MKRQTVKWWQDELYLKTKAKVVVAARVEITEQIKECADRSACARCGNPIPQKESIKFGYESPLVDLFDTFLNIEALDYKGVAIKDDGQGLQFASSELASRWQVWHAKYADPRVVHVTCDLPRECA